MGKYLCSCVYLNKNAMKHNENLTRSPAIKCILCTSYWVLLLLLLLVSSSTSSSKVLFYCNPHKIGAFCLYRIRLVRRLRLFQYALTSYNSIVDTLRSHYGGVLKKTHTHLHTCAHGHACARAAKCKIANK